MEEKMKVKEAVRDSDLPTLVTVCGRSLPYSALSESGSLALRLMPGDEFLYDGETGEIRKA
jgi:hypothetical protein